MRLKEFWKYNNLTLGLNYGGTKATPSVAQTVRLWICTVSGIVAKRIYERHSGHLSCERSEQEKNKTLQENLMIFPY